MDWCPNYYSFLVNSQKFTYSVPTESPTLTPKTDQITQLDQPWNVIVFDDPVNLMEYVTKVIMKIFGYPKQKAEVMMIEVHEKGRSIVWSGSKELAELYVQQLHQAQLTAGMDKSNDW